MCGKNVSHGTRGLKAGRPVAVAAVAVAVVAAAVVAFVAPAISSWPATWHAALSRARVCVVLAFGATAFASPASTSRLSAARPPRLPLGNHPALPLHQHQ